jgi:hypothetical protein
MFGIHLLMIPAGIVCVDEAEFLGIVLHRLLTGCLWTFLALCIGSQLLLIVLAVCRSSCVMPPPSSTCWTTSGDVRKLQLARCCIYMYRACCLRMYAAATYQFTSHFSSKFGQLAAVKAASCKA